MAKELKCTSCDAPLVPKVGENAATCTYCGAVTVLADSEMKPVAPFRTRAVSTAQKKSRTALWVITLAAVIGSAALFLPAIFGTSWFALTQEWYSLTCLVDANGDGVLDAAGMGAGAGSERWRLRLVDGATGKPLWSGESYSTSANLVCLSPQFFGVDDVDFHLHLFPARNPDKALNIMLSDHVDKVGLGADCLEILQTNGMQYFISFIGDSVSRCNTAGLLENRGISRSNDRSSLTDNGITYTLSTRQPGTPFLIASASNGAGILWIKELPVVRAWNGFSMTSTPNMLVIWGGAPSDDDYGVIIGLDPKTGDMHYAVTQASHWSGNLFDITFNGRYVITAWGFGLQAYDPSNGKSIWNIGGR